MKLRDDPSADCDALLKMLAGTEEDTDEAQGKFRFRPERLEPSQSRYPRVGNAVRKIFEHQTRTGHNVLLCREAGRPRTPQTDPLPDETDYCCLSTAPFLSEHLD